MSAPQPIRAPPQPIKQTKVQHTHSQLTSIPSINFPSNIRELYLSHNHISSVQGLSSFTHLKCLNLSYNRLTSVDEVIHQIKSKEGGKLGCQSSLKRLSLRMNQFHYGYEDEVIFSLPTLERLDDIDLKKANMKLILSMRQKISDSFIHAWISINSLIEEIATFSSEKERLDEFIPVQKIAILSNKLSESLKRTHEHHPPSQTLEYIEPIIYEFLDISQQIKHIPNYSKVCQDTFMNLTRFILMKLSTRYNYGLLRRLTGSSSSTNIGDVEFQSLARQFGKISGYKYSLEEDPGKYIEEINPNQLQSHSMYQYLNFQRKNLNTLDGDGPSRYSILANHRHKKQQEKIIFEALPVFVFQPNYLQVLKQICQDKVKELIRAYDTVSQRQKLAKSWKLQINESQKKINEQKIDTKHQLKSQFILIEEESQISRKTQRSTLLKSKKKQSKENDLCMRKTESGEEKLQRSKQKEMPKNEMKKQKKQVNYKKYTLYEINLAFKVLRSLKKNKIRRQAKRTK